MRYGMPHIVHRQQKSLVIVCWTQTFTHMLPFFQGLARCKVLTFLRKGTIALSMPKLESQSRRLMHAISR